MTENNDRNSPPAQAEDHSGVKRELPPTAPQQEKVGRESKNNPNDDTKTAEEMRREFRWFEFGSLVINGALAIIGIIALSVYHGQLKVMQGQLEQMQGQRELMQQQLTQMQLQLPELQKSAKAAQDSASLSKHSVVGAEAAMVSAGIGADTRGLVVSFYNFGKSIATNITGSYTVSRKNLGTGRLIGRPRTIAINVTQMKGVESHGNPGFYAVQLDPDFLDLAPITQLKETVIVEGTITFNDGFDDIIPVHICNQLLANINGQTGDYIGYIPIDCAEAARWVIGLKSQSAKLKASQPK